MSDQPSPFSPERIADRLAIQDVMYRWCRAVDRLDREDMLAVFHPEATDSHGAYIGPVAGLVDWIMQRHRAIPFSSHLVSNMLIEFASRDVALAETYTRTIQRYPASAKAELAQLAGGQSGAEDRGMDLFTSSRYLDTFERRGAEWRIAKRVLIQDWKQLVEVSAHTPQAQPSWVVGRRDADDPLFVARRELGIA